MPWGLEGCHGVWIFENALRAVRAVVGHAATRSPPLCAEKTIRFVSAAVKAARTLESESWPRFADPGNSATWRALGPGNPPVNGQYPGFPVTIRQIDNYGRAPAAYLPLVVEEAVNNPVIEVVDDASGKRFMRCGSRDIGSAPPAAIR